MFASWQQIPPTRSPAREKGQKPGRGELSSLGKPRDFHPGFLPPWKQQKEPTHLSGSGRKQRHLFAAQEGPRTKEEAGGLLAGGLAVGWKVCACSQTEPRKTRMSGWPVRLCALSVAVRGPGCSHCLAIILPAVGAQSIPPAHTCYSVTHHGKPGVPHWNLPYFPDKN